jgi:hypothetical protein
MAQKVPFADDDDKTVSILHCVASILNCWEIWSRVQMQIQSGPKVS